MAKIHTLLQSTRIRYFHKLQRLTKLLTKRTKCTTLLNKCYRSSSDNTARHSIVQFGITIQIAVHQWLSLRFQSLKIKQS